MKKRILMIAAVLSLAIASPVMADDTASEPTVQELMEQMQEMQKQIEELQGSAGVSEQTEEGASGGETENEEVADASASSGEGRRVMLNESVNVDEWGSFAVMDAGFTDCVQAISAVPESLKITPTAGNTLFQARISFKTFNKDNPLVSNAFSCKLINAGTVYDNGWTLLEAKQPDGSHHTEVSLSSLLNHSDRLRYLYNVEGSSMTVYGNLVDYDNLYGDCALFDYAVEIPASVADETDDSSLILQIDVNGTPLYYQVR